MSRVACCEIAGWGYVGSSYGVTSAVSNGALVTVSVAGGVGTLFAGEIGADIRLIGSAVFDRRMTLVSVTSNTIVLRDYSTVARADLSVGVFVRVEDPYRVSTGTPSFVTGTAAAARWFAVIADIPPTLGASVPVDGGVSVVDSIRIGIQTDVSRTPLRDLWRIEAPVLESEGRVVVTSTAMSAQSSQVLLEEGVDFDAGATLLHIDEEAITYTAMVPAAYQDLTVVRGVLGTVPAPHSRGTIITKVPPTYIGARARVIVYNAGATGRDDFAYSLDGVLDAPEYGAGTASYTLPIRSELINAYAGGVRARLSATARWEGDDIIITQRTPFQAWSWIDIGGMAYQLTPTNDITENVSTGDVERRYEINRWRGPSNPVVLNPEAERDFILDSLGYFQIDASSYEFVDGDYASVFRGQTVPMDLLLGGGEPMPCAVLSNRTETYATAPVSTTNPQDLLSRGYAECDVITAILQVLCSTGSGNNRGQLDTHWGGYQGTVDALPADMGLGVPQSRLHVDSFLPGAIQRPLPLLAGLAMTADDATNPAEWLERTLLKPLHLALTTRKDGKIALVDLTAIPIDLEDASPLDLRQSLRAGENAPTPVVSVGWDTSGIVTGVRVTWHRASEPLDFRVYPTDEDRSEASEWRVATRVTVVVRGDLGGVGRTSLMDRISAGSLNMEPGWIVFGNDMVDAIRASAGAYMQQQGIPRLRIVATITETGVNSAIELGDVVALTADAIPGATGTRGLTQYARVYGIRRNLLNATMQVELLVIGRTPWEARWVASGRIAGVASTTDITIEPNAFAVNGGRFSTDVAAFRFGDVVLLASSAFEILCTNAPEITNVHEDESRLTLSVAFSDGSPITPEEGQLILVAPRDVQPLVNTLTRGWLDHQTDGIDNANRTRWR